MTGFGSSETTRNGWQIRVEIKAVNHRYSEVVVRMPRQFSILEEAIRREIQKKLVRGRIEVFLNIEETEEKKSKVTLDKDLALAYHETLNELSVQLGQELEISAYQLAKLPEVMQVTDEDVDLEFLSKLVLETVENALIKLTMMRCAEGEQLSKNLHLKLHKLTQMIQQIKARAPEVVLAYQQKLTERIDDLLHQLPVDESRIATEVAIFADKANIDEELVRMVSHCHQFQRTLESKEPVGRKLDFLVQEMNREINTIGSKANDAYIAHLVVEAKSELEKIREQVQNIE